MRTVTRLQTHDLALHNSADAARKHLIKLEGDALFKIVDMISSYGNTRSKITYCIGEDHTSLLSCLQNLDNIRKDFELLEEEEGD